MKSPSKRSGYWWLCGSCGSEFPTKAFADDCCKDL